MSVNIIAKCVKGKEYLMGEMIATRLTEKQWEELKSANLDKFGDTEQYTWRYIPQRETDFSWWDRITKKLTKTKLIGGCEFTCDYYGKITEY